MHRSDSWWDVMEVCLNGHQITAYAESQPDHRQKFCDECGEKTISACEKCGTNMRGYRHVDGVISISKVPVPKYCLNCGTPYPWQAAKTENFREILQETELSREDLQEADKALPDILRETPRTEIASLKMKRIMGKVGKPIYGILLKVITDLASEGAKKAMGLG